jgi:hypothetical protein
MHREIAGAPPGKKADHANHDTTDNRRSNLRAATDSQSSANTRKTTRPTSSRYKGVGWHKQKGKWYAQIEKDGHRSYLGYFDDEIDAAYMYDRTARRLHGAFALTNFPTDDPSRGIPVRRQVEGRPMTSRYKGVRLSRHRGKWRAEIMKDRRTLYLGMFASEEDAARAYDRKALELHGPAARLNFPEYPTGNHEDMKM